MGLFRSFSSGGFLDKITPFDDVLGEGKILDKVTPQFIDNIGTKLDPTMSGTVTNQFANWVDENKKPIGAVALAGAAWGANIATGGSLTGLAVMATGNAVKQVGNRIIEVKQGTQQEVLLKEIDAERAKQLGLKQTAEGTVVDATGQVMDIKIKKDYTWYYVGGGIALVVVVLILVLATRK